MQKRSVDTLRVDVKHRYMGTFLLTRVWDGFFCCTVEHAEIRFARLNCTIPDTWFCVILCLAAGNMYQD
jgi:hypothetical protein